MNFETFLFHPQIAAGIAAAGYSTPTPIQTQAIPKVMQGCDLMGLAQTGTGKTAVFALPILNRLLYGQRGRVRALIIAPTRELAEQIHQAIEILGSKTGLRSVTVYGGVGIQRQVQLLKSADIVVACPGRLLDHLSQDCRSFPSGSACARRSRPYVRYGFFAGYSPDINPPAAIGSTDLAVFGHHAQSNSSTGW